ncbi:MAG: hypothetical protein OEZ13_10355 [Spirochaetia bacterium]|nr:hypothetical protein [Spirochaetia bacterium]
MDAKQKTQLIRQGNEAFNKGQVLSAAKIFKTVNYKDGLIRVGDYFYYDKHQPLMAYGYYRLAKHSIMIEKIFDGFVFAIQCWMADETPTETQQKKEKNIGKEDEDKNTGKPESQHILSNLPEEP